MSDGGRLRDGGREAAAKADARLRQVLAAAPEGRRLRCVLTLREADDGPAPKPPHPADFADRVEYRQAMIEHQGAKAGGAVGDARRALAELGLEVTGGSPAGRLLVVEGSAAAVRAALGLEAVERGALDRAMETPAEPGSPGAELSGAEPPGAEPSGDDDSGC